MKIEKDDLIEIECKGIMVSGKVLSAINYGGKDGWYIEFLSESGDYHYWKQGKDGGKVILK
ncbi:MAG: hypothetical protein ACOCP8_05270 [archaeon]